MSDKSTTLPLPAAIDAAYLLLVGQLCLSLSKLAFGAVFVVENNISVEIDISTKSVTIWVLSGLITVMLFVNIMSCWRSTRSTFDEIGHYPNSLLFSDVLIIVAFFLLNSVASAPLAFTQTLELSSSSIGAFLIKISNLWEPIVPLLYFVTSLLVLSYRAWNKAYVEELKKIKKEEDIADTVSSIDRFNVLYVSASIIFAIFGVSEIVLDSFAMSLAFSAMWLAFWFYVNFSWIVSKPTG